MGFNYEGDTLLVVEIDGNTYQAPVDSPEFIAYWRKWQQRANELAAYTALTHEQAEAVPDDEAEQVALDSVQMCAELVVALFGTATAQAIFNGRERSLLFCMGLSDYIYNQIAEQDLAGRITKATRKYSADAIQGD